MLIPWKWMALEYLIYDVLTLKSDVWSFGVVVWEIFSFGKAPYGHKDFDEVLEMLESGHRLLCPSEIENISQETLRRLYRNLADKCFIGDPNDRPPFCDLVSMIETEMTEEEQKGYIDNTQAYHSRYVENYLSLNKNKK